MAGWRSRAQFMDGLGLAEYLRNMWGFLHHALVSPQSNSVTSLSKLPR